MAIFEGTYDRKTVPLLVQLAQIETGNIYELRHAVQLATIGVGYGRLVDRVSMSFSSDVLESASFVCDYVKRSLHGLATESAVPADCLDWLNGIPAAPHTNIDIPDHSEKYLDGDSVTFHGQELMSLDDLIVKRVQSSFGWFDVIVAHELLNNILDALAEYRETGRKIFTICPECNNPFRLTLDSRKEQIYCSHRCADRAGQRRRYQIRAQNKL